MKHLPILMTAMLMLFCHRHAMGQLSESDSGSFQLESTGTAYFQRGNVDFTSIRKKGSS